MPLGDSYLSEHNLCHSTLETVAFELVKKGVIIFNPETGKYGIKNTSNHYEQSLDFDSIAIKQKKNICLSRLDVNINSEILRGVNRPCPLIASNMSTVINSTFYNKLYELGAFSFLHRAIEDELYIEEVKRVSEKCQWVAASIGISEDQYKLIPKLIDAGCNIIVIDVAHGYSDFIIELGKKIKSNFPVKVVVGNTVNPDIMFEVSDWADGVKVGIGQGFACETAITAGCTEKQFGAVLKFKDISKKLGLPIISDGGIQKPADFVKALAGGASGVMAGKIFAACPESAAEVISVNGVSKKIYAGMASRYVQSKWKGNIKHGTCPEGTIKYLDIGEPVDRLIERYCGALRSGITYAGASSLKNFNEIVEFVHLK